MLELRLSALPATTLGIYGPGHDRLGARMLFLEPAAALAFAELEAATGGLVYSDILRSADESLAAMSAKRGVMAPGFSGHNFGVSVDVDVDGALGRLGVGYASLLAVMGAHGWYCHRRDGMRGPEDWHFNHLTVFPSGAWGAAVEARIMGLYGDSFALDDREVQTALGGLRMYVGEVDGVFGPLTRAAVGAFARAWRVPAVADARLRRVLAFVTATRVVALGALAPGAPST